MHTLRRSFLEYVGQTSPNPLGLIVDKAEGVNIIDNEGNEFVDLISGIGVSSLGHGNKSVITAVKEQAEKFMHTMVYGEHVQRPQLQFAELLCENLPDSLNNVFYVNSGTEAVEGAMKLAKKVTGRYEMASCKNAYHGSTHGAQSLMDSTYFSTPYRPFLPGITFIEYNDIESLDLITEKTAGVFVETIRGEAGVEIASAEFMIALRKKCSDTGALLILDEIQSGFGRTGKLFAFEHYGIVPDVLLIAKAMGAGMPIGAFVTDNEKMKSLSVDPILGHINTFGGHPVSAAAAYAGLQYLLETDLMSMLPSKSALFNEMLQHPRIKELRAIGLMIAMDLGDRGYVQKLVKFAYEHGVLVDWFLFNDSSIRIAPPLIINADKIASVCQVFLNGLDLL